jgi:hypothetical protein
VKMCEEKIRLSRCRWKKETSQPTYTANLYTITLLGIDLHVVVYVGRPLSPRRLDSSECAIDMAWPMVSTTAAVLEPNRTGEKTHER